MPTNVIPIQFVNVSVDAEINDVPCTLGVERVAAWIAIRKSGAGGIRKVVIMPAGVIPIELLYVGVSVPVDDVLRAITKNVAALVSG